MATSATTSPSPPPPLPLLTADAVPSSKEERALAVEAATLPRGATRNTLKEAVTLDYVAHFDAQFRALYPERRALLLAPLNEAGVRKFVCTTLRAARAPAGRVYDARGAARFVAAHCAYEPLDPPTAPPARLPSPALTLTARAGDAFDLSFLLCSLLLGAGYAAAVAVGTAPVWVTLRRTEVTEAGDDAWAPPPPLDTTPPMCQKTPDNLTFL